MRLLVLIALFGAVLLPARAADMPAQMVTGKRSIEELLRLPKNLKPGRYSLQCGVLIGTSGWALFVRCHPRGSEPYDLQKAVMYATKTSLFVPATHNGKRVEVYATLTVKVDTSLGGDPLILAVPNDGADAARYGPLYTAPQRYGGSHINMPILPLHQPRRTAVVWMKLQIDERGVMTQCTLIDDWDAPDWWIGAVNTAAKQMTFIPGHHDGKPVPMLFVQPMLWRY